MNLEFNCPHCNKLLAIDETWRNTEIKCPNCGNSLVPQKVIAKNKEVERARKKKEKILENFKREDEERAKQEEAQIRKLKREESHRTKPDLSWGLIMALGKCRKCGKEVSGYSDACPYCGCRYGFLDRMKEPPIGWQGCFVMVCAVICAVILALLLFSC